jgi:pimeloyl-ACP methyl ester carboxylesterase
LEEVATLGGGAVLVGHSLGASILLKALADGESMPAAKAVFLIAAPYWGGKGWSGWEDVELSEDAFARLSETGPMFFYHGTDDAVVPAAHLDLYAMALPHAKLQRLAGRDHQLNDDLSEVAADVRSLAEGGGG